jgi:hypothetical protein
LGEARFFIRDDDVGELTGALRAFVETFVARALPVSYQIIPSQLTGECAAYLAAVRRTHPGLVQFGQHGLHHKMTVGRRALKREFGPERSFLDQKATIDQGLAILRRELGDDAPIEVFTPPQHKFDGNTVRAAAAAGHRVFSASSYPTLHHQFAYAFGRALGWSSIAHHGISYHGGRRPEADIDEVSIAIDVDDGKRRKRSAIEVVARLRALGGRTTSVGLMFHHALYGDGQGREALTAIADRFAALGPERFASLASLASRSHSAPVVS